jgi:hypothetical protein
MAIASPIGTVNNLLDAGTGVPGGPSGSDEVTAILKPPVRTRIAMAWAK